MILFFQSASNKIFAVGSKHPLPPADIEKLEWLFSGGKLLTDTTLKNKFIGPRKEMVTPWSTNAVEITQTMGISGIDRIEEFVSDSGNEPFDKMLNQHYAQLDQEIFTIHHSPDPIVEIGDIANYSKEEGLALSEEEIEYLNNISTQLNRKLTDSEVFGFSQVNSEHCRHKIFNGTYIIDGEEKEMSLFQLIKKTSKENPNYIVSAYSDNVAFIKGPSIEQFAPKRQDTADYFEVKDIESVLSLKAETHNFPTTVEPFNGAATGSGGEIRDRLAGGKGSLPLAGTAVYMTSYPRLEKGKAWEENFEERNWLYQTPAEILIKASDGASDFGNKFGQPLISGSVLTFEHFEKGKQYGYDKVIMQAGGIGFGKHIDSAKGELEAGDKIVLLGGDNYRIGMGGGAVSSVATGEYGNAIELNAIQRSNPEMQKRVMNAIRAMVESENNPIVTIHDHGAGGHLNCFSELLEKTGGAIHIDQLPVGDPTLSDKELISNESQERMGLGIKEKDIDTLRKVAERERSPIYVVGDATGDQKLIFDKAGQEQKPVDLAVNQLFGSSPKTIIQDTTEKTDYQPIEYDAGLIEKYIEQVLQLESVACKDWLTNKVDRSVTGKVATQQTCGPIQLPLNNVAVMALDFLSHKGVATSIGHAPGAALIDPATGSKLAIAEALTNLVWAPLANGIKGVSLSANWMWPCKKPGEDARLYKAVEAVSDFSIKLGLNVPTGKDSLSMAQKYPDGKTVLSPGTVIISAIAEVSDIRKTISPVLQPIEDSQLFYVDFSSDTFSLGGSAFAQTLHQLSDQAPSIKSEAHFVKAFEAIQELINKGLILSGHDISAGGLITALLEMCFAEPTVGMDVSLSDFEPDLVTTFFSENPGVVIQVNDPSTVLTILAQHGVKCEVLGTVNTKRNFTINYREQNISLEIDKLRDTWFKTSYLLDRKQRNPQHAEKRFANYKNQSLAYTFQPAFDGTFKSFGIDPARRTTTGIKAAIIREKGVNGDREMAYSLFLAGFDVKDVHMTDLVAGRENLSDVNMIVFVGGFSNSDVLGSAKGWAGAFLYNPKAKEALDNFYKREDTLSLGVCNGCQLMMELGLLYPEWKDHPKMHHNGSGKFESTFINVTIPENDAIMLHSMAGTRLGVWVAHGEGRFTLPEDTGLFNVGATYSQQEYPGNPNDSDFSVASLYSKDGRHLAIMPHIERSLFPWNWPFYPYERKNDAISPWMEAFVNAREWIKNQS